MVKEKISSPKKVHRNWEMITLLESGSCYESRGLSTRLVSPILCGLLGISLLSNTAVAKAPYEMSYGGRLATPSGEAIRGPVDLEIAFFREASGGSPIPVSPIVRRGVALSDGVFQIDFSELSPAEMHLVFSSSLATWVEARDTTNRTVYPRQRLTAVPYAFKVPTDDATVTFDSEGRLAVGAITMGQVKGLDAALAQKSESSKTYGISDITGLTTALAGKAGTSASLVGDVGGTLAATSVNKIRGYGVATPTTASTYLKYDGTNLVWSAVAAGSSGDMLKADNLSGLSSIAAARTNLGLQALAVESVVTSALISDGTIVDADISGSAAISDSKLAPITTAGRVSGSSIISGTIGGSTVVATSGQLSSSGNIRVAGTGVTATELRFGDNDDSNYVGFKAPATVGADRIWTLPAADGSNGQLLTTDGGGNLSWVSGGGSGTVTSVNLTAPAAGIAVSGGPVTGSGTITLALGDDLAAVEGISTTGAVERTAANTWTTFAVTGAGKALIDDVDATAQRTTLGLGALATAAVVSGGTAGTITDDTITNADINSAAAIVTSKLSGAVTSISGHGLGALATLSAVSGGTSGMITDDSITDADINSAAGIVDTKLATISTAGRVLGSAITSGTIGGSTVFSGSGGVSTTGNISGGLVTGSMLITGTGDNGGTPGSGTVRSANGMGTDKLGTDLTVAAGNGTGTGGSGKILFQTAPVAGSSATANTMATRMTIANNGRVGIGTTTPQASLEVAGTIVSNMATTLTPSGTTQTIDLSTANIQRLYLGSATGTVTLTLSNPIIGGVYIIVIIQGATPRAVTWPAAVKWTGGTPVVLSGASATDVLTFLYDGTNYFALANRNFQ